MSHFSTLVIGEEPEALLAPFDEGTEVEPYRRYEDGTAEEHWWVGAMRRDLAGFRRAEEIGEAAILAELVADFASRASSWDRETPEEKAKKELVDFCWAAERAKQIDDQPMTWSTLVDLYNERWHSGDEDNGEKLYLAEDGRAYTMSTYNPKSKWDWYSLGGRWTGYFKLRDNARGRVGRPGLMTDSAKPGWVDQARKEDIDFEGMRAQAEAEAISEHAMVRAALAEVGKPMRWEHVREQMFPDDIDAARRFYNSQPGVKALHDANIYADEPVDWYCLDEDDPQAAYVARRVARADLPFAILTADGWAQKGRMGWWGIVTDQDADWYTLARRLIDEAPDSALFSLYDLHI